jgi:Arc/MetJ-type ribon-helix-helix transcriptional regulator
VISPEPVPDATARPHLSLVPASSPPPASSPDDALLASPPDIDLDDIQVLAPIKTEGETDIGSPAFPGFPTPDLRLDTEWNTQPHWVTDAKGEPFTFRLSPPLSRVITILVESNATPYRSKSDFVRDACYYLAKAIRDLTNLKDQRLETELAEANAISKAAHESRLQEKVLTYEVALTDAVIGCIERRALHEACRELDAAWQWVETIPVMHRRGMYQAVFTQSPLIQAVLALGQTQGYQIPTDALIVTPPVQTGEHAV